MTRKRMAARYAGDCQACGTNFPEGTEILWARQGGATHADLIACSKAGQEAHELAQERTADEADRQTPTTRLRPLAEPVVMPKRVDIDLTSSPGVKVWGSAIVLATVILYVIFW